MGGIAIIGLGNRMGRHQATVQDYTGLYHAIGGTKTGHQSLTSRYIIINGYGETVAPSKHATWTPTIVASWVKRGHIWIDYTGWPMYYQGHANGQVQTLGPSGWHQLAAYLGYTWLNHVSFALPAIHNPYQYPFRRGFPLNQSLDGVCYPANSRTFSVPGGLLGIGGGTYPVTANGFTALLALHPPGGGYYIYATYFYALLGGVQTGVPPALVSQFVKQMVHNNHAGLVCSSYKLSTQTVSTPTPGPSSPIQVTSIPHHSSSTGGKPTTGKPTAFLTSTAGSPTTGEKLLLGGAAVTGLGLITSAVMRHQRRTQP